MAYRGCKYTYYVPITQVDWVAVKEADLSYYNKGTTNYNKETPLSTIYPYDGNLNHKPFTPNIHVMVTEFQFLNSNPIDGQRFSESGPGARRRNPARNSWGELFQSIPVRFHPNLLTPIR